MFAVLLTACLAFALVLITQAVCEPAISRKMTSVILLGYGVRVSLQIFLRDLPLFSYGTGGDCMGYEYHANMIARIWQGTHVHFMTLEDLPVDDIANALLPVNIFASIVYLNGEPTRLGCVAFIAFIACLTCVNLYKLAVECGADHVASYRIAWVLLFSPGFLFYTSDTYKDGLVAFLVTTAVSYSVRLSRRVSLYSVSLAILSLFALWFVRFYLVFIVFSSLLIGVLGVGSRSKMRIVMAFVGLFALSGMLSQSSTVWGFAGQANTTFDVATAQNVREYNALGGSGVVFDDGGKPWGALGQKLFYTLFSPFPWQLGSLGFQVGKLDALLWYYLAYRAYLGARQLWKEDRSLLLMLLMFIVPCTVAYAATVANVGLILRQRIPIVMISAVLAARSWPAGSFIKRARALGTWAPISRSDRVVGLGESFLENVI